MSGLSEEQFINQFAPDGGDQQNIDNQNTDQQNIANQDLDGQNQDQLDNNQNLPELSPMEQKAFDQGWRPKEEFEGSEDNWKTAKEYVRDGEWMDKLKQVEQRMERERNEFDQRLDNANKLQEARRKQELDTLKKKQREAVDLADTDAFDEASRQIDELSAQSVPEVKNQQPAMDPLITQYVNDNPWINDPNDNRTIIAMGALQAYQGANPSASIQDAINHVNSKVNELTAPNNPRRQQPNANEHSRRQTRSQNRELTMNDLTNEERSEWASFGKTLFKTEKAYLAAVKDARGK